jgi:lipopolysaccharide transport system permease protein
MFVLLGLGLGLTAGALMVRFRDVGYVLPLVVQLFLFLSPVAYQLSAVPADKLTLYELNPLAGLLEGWRWAVLGTTAPSVGLVTYSVVFTLVVFVIGLVVFNRMERGFADVI